MTTPTCRSWADVAQLRGLPLPLIDVALLIARDEYPMLDTRLCHAHLDACVETTRQAIARREGDEPELRSLSRHLFEELGFSGDDDPPDDPRNSYLNEVLERRRGLPITLALVQMAVAERVGVSVEGISFPGHFLVRSPMGDGFVVLDPFNRGRALGMAELRRRAAQHFNRSEIDDATVLHLLQPASPRQILARMLRNLIAAYQQRNDDLRVARCADRLLCLLPADADALRDRGLAYAGIGHYTGASRDLRHYLKLQPQDDAVADVLLGLDGRTALH